MSADPPRERFVALSSGGHALHGILHEGRGARAVVMCQGFAEEEKCAHRVLVDLARRLAADGWWVLRFDYSGCGESEGDFGQYGLSAWREDIGAALDFARRAASVAQAALFGVRLGATLAAEVADGRDEVQALGLWEPILDGPRYLTHNLRRSQIKQQMTRLEGGTEGAEADQPASGLPEGDVDFDGYHVTRTLQEEIGAINLLATDRSYPGPVYLVSITARDEPSRGITDLGRRYARPTVDGLREQPFWNTIGIVEPTILIERTTAWMRTLLEPFAGHHDE